MLAQDETMRFSAEVQPTVQRKDLEEGLLDDCDACTTVGRGRWRPLSLLCRVTGLYVWGGDWKGKAWSCLACVLSWVSFCMVTWNQAAESWNPPEGFDRHFSSMFQLLVSVGAYAAPFFCHAVTHTLFIIFIQQTQTDVDSIDTFTKTKSPIAKACIYGLTASFSVTVFGCVWDYPNYPHIFGVTAMFVCTLYPILCSLVMCALFTEICICISSAIDRHFESVFSGDYQSLHDIIEHEELMRNTHHGSDSQHAKDTTHDWLSTWFLVHCIGFLVAASNEVAYVLFDMKDSNLYPLNLAASFWEACALLVPFIMATCATRKWEAHLLRLNRSLFSSNHPFHDRAVLELYLAYAFRSKNGFLVFGQKISISQTLFVASLSGVSALAKFISILN